MSTTLKILRYELRDLVRSRWVIGYLLFFAAFAEALYRVQGRSTSVLLNLVDVVLLLIPLATRLLYAVRGKRGRQPMIPAYAFAGLLQLWSVV